MSKSRKEKLSNKERKKTGRPPWQVQRKRRNPTALQTHITQKV